MTLKCCLKKIDSRTSVKDQQNIQAIVVAIIYNNKTWNHNSRYVYHWQHCNKQIQLITSSGQHRDDRLPTKQTKFTPRGRNLGLFKYVFAQSQISPLWGKSGTFWAQAAICVTSIELYVNHGINSLVQQDKRKNE